MKCVVCQGELTDRQERRYRQKHGKRKYLRIPPTCSVECSAKWKQTANKTKRDEFWARREKGWDGKIRGGLW